VTDTEEALFVLEHSEARAFVSKEVDLDDLDDALRRVAAFPEDESTWVWRSEQRAFVPSGEAFPRESTLTPREREVFMLMREGLLDKQIAERLHRSVHTIRVQIRAIRRKRGSSRRAEIEG
jgi:DNA-binding NarL/FixJ family response regulator